MKRLLVSAVLVVLISGCVSGYTLESGMNELLSIEGNYIDDTGGAVKGNIDNLISELQSFKSRIDGQEGLEALSLFADFKISYYSFIRELEALTRASQEASCSAPEAIDDLIDSAGSVMYYSDRISDDISQLILGYGAYIDNETISGMEMIRDDVNNSTRLLMGVVDGRISFLMNCSGEQGG